MRNMISLKMIVCTADITLFTRSVSVAVVVKS